MSILFINACVRENSRTLVLAKNILSTMPGEMIEVNLNQENIVPLNRELLEKREKLISGGDHSDTMFCYAKQFAQADEIVIAAPFWDLSFPAILKTYIEQITVSGITFEYTFYQNMYDEMKDGGVPQSIQDLEQLAEHYHLSSVFMAQEAYEQVQRGILPWNAWLPDGTHPHHIGSYFYANAVIAFLQEELNTPNPCTACKGDALPAPVNQKHWENTADIAFDTVTTHGAWSVAREVHIPWFDRRLMTYGLGDWLEFTFEGRGLAIVFSYGKSSGLIEYQLDGGDWEPYVCQRYWWMPEENFVNAVRMFDDLPDGEHHVKLRVSHANTDGCNSSNCNILKLCAVK